MSMVYITVIFTFRREGLQVADQYASARSQRLDFFHLVLARNQRAHSSEESSAFVGFIDDETERFRIVHDK